MTAVFNRAGMSTNTAGQGTLTLASALGAVSINTASFQSFVAAGVTDQTVVPYLILDANGNWELGTGTYTSSGTTLSRTVKYSSNSNTAISLSGSAQVFIGALATDGGDVLAGTTNPMRGFDAPVNLQLNATSNGALLTVAVKTNTGNDPTVTNPALIPFRDPTVANGDPIWRSVSAALSINTNATGATLGSSSNKAFRLWVVAFDNAGTVVLALINCSTSSSTAAQIFPLNETNVASTTAISGTATAAGTFYTPNGTTLSNKAFRIIGYVEYNATGLATAGTYASAPTFAQLFGPGIKKPGDVVQTMMTTTSSGTNNSSATYQSQIAPSITPISAANPIMIEASGDTFLATSLNTGFITIFRGTTGGTKLISTTLANVTTGGIHVPGALKFIDGPNTASAQTYTIATAGDGAHGAGFGISGDTGIFASMILTELMG